MILVLLIAITVGAIADSNATNSSNYTVTVSQYLLTSAEKCMTMEGYKFCTFNDDIAQSVYKNNNTKTPIKYGYCCYHNDTSAFTEP
jgi:hypothetical protein